MLTSLRGRVRSRRVFAAALAAAVVGAAVGGFLAASGGSRTGVRPAPVSNVVLEARVRDAQLVDPTIGWALSNRLFRTTSGGETWSDITPAGVNAARIRGAFFLDAANGWIVGSRGDTPAESVLVVYRTSDGGRSWTESEVGAPSADTADAITAPAWFDFLDRRHGWLSVALVSSAAFSRGALYRTDDAGATWERVQLPIAAPVEFATASDGWTAGGVAGAEMFVTHDGGARWSPTRIAPAGAAYELPTSSGGPADGLPVTLANGSSSTLAWYRTRDRGRTWRLVQRIDAGGALEPGVALPTAVTGAGDWIGALAHGRRMATVVSRGTSTAVRTAGGLPLNDDSAVTKLSFASATTGWAIVRGSYCARFKADCSTYEALFGTTDSGSSWRQLTP